MYILFFLLPMNDATTLSLFTRDREQLPRVAYLNASVPHRCPFYETDHNSIWIQRRWFIDAPRKTLCSVLSLFVFIEMMSVCFTFPDQYDYISFVWATWLLKTLIFIVYPYFALNIGLSHTRATQSDKKCSRWINFL